MLPTYLPVRNEQQPRFIRRDHVRFNTTGGILGRVEEKSIRLRVVSMMWDELVGFTGKTCGQGAKSRSPASQGGINSLTRRIGACTCSTVQTGRDGWTGLLEGLLIFECGQLLADVHQITYSSSRVHRAVTVLYPDEPSCLYQVVSIPIPKKLKAVRIE